MQLIVSITVVFGHTLTAITPEYLGLRLLKISFWRTIWMVLWLLLTLEWLLSIASNLFSIRVKHSHPSIHWIKVSSWLFRLKIHLREVNWTNCILYIITIYHATSVLVLYKYCLMLICSILVLLLLICLLNILVVVHHAIMLHWRNNLWILLNSIQLVARLIIIGVLGQSFTSSISSRVRNIVFLVKCSCSIKLIMVIFVILILHGNRSLIKCLSIIVFRFYNLTFILLYYFLLLLNILFILVLLC